MTALFNNTHEALIFAFNYSTQQYALSPMSKLALKGAGSGKGLVSVDGAGQAGLILAHVNRLSSVHKCCITARFAVKTRDCQCCGAEAMGEQYAEAIMNLMELSMGCFSGVSVRKVREAIIRSFYERGISLQGVAERFNLPKTTAYRQKELVWDWLKKVDTEAQRLIDESLQPLFKK